MAEVPALALPAAVWPWVEGSAEGSPAPGLEALPQAPGGGEQGRLLPLAVYTERHSVSRPDNAGSLVSAHHGHLGRLYL